MRNIALTIEYDGSNYSGWQRQDNSSSIQEEIEKAIYLITGNSVNLIASGRTDSGVHALGQVANYIDSSTIPSDRLKYAINTKLPADISIKNSYEVDKNFNARYDAKRKTYLYIIENIDVKNPLLLRRTMHIRGKVDIDKMVEQSRYLVGTHDFTSFYKIEKNNPKNPTRTIYDLQIKKFNDSIIFIEITADGFLYNMVRIIVGTLVDISKGKIKSDIKSILSAKDRAFAGITAQSSGLYLKNVEY